MEVPDASGDGADRQMDGVPDGWTDEWLGAERPERQMEKGPEKRLKERKQPEQGFP
jgi:hypothetical protein